jgi:predicted transcriptional regulator
MPSKDVLPKNELEVQRKVWHAINEFPGLYSHELHKVTMVPLDHIERILGTFEQDNIVFIRLEEGKKQYFPFITMGPKEGKMVALIHQPIVKDIVNFLLGAPHSTMKEIEHRIKVPKTKISPLMDELFRQGVISLAKDTHKCNITTFQIFEPETIEKMLMVKERSLPVLI